MNDLGIKSTTSFQHDVCHLEKKRERKNFFEIKILNALNAKNSSLISKYQISNGKLFSFMSVIYPSNLYITILQDLSSYIFFSYISFYLWFARLCETILIVCIIHIWCWFIFSLLKHVKALTVIFSEMEIFNSNKTLKIA